MKKQKGNTHSVNKLVDPTHLKAHPLNCELFRHNSHYVRVLESMREKGYLSQYPITCTTSKIIIAGHTRVKAAIELKISQIPAIIIPTNTPEEELIRFMIDDNLSRPKECRKLSYLEKFVLALRLAETRPEQRGGNRKVVNASERTQVIAKNKFLSDQVDISLKYFNMLCVSVRAICAICCEAFPEMREFKIYDQVNYILKNKLSQELEDLHAGSLKISKLHEKYKKTKKIKESLITNAGHESAPHHKDLGKKQNNYTQIMEAVACFKTNTVTTEMLEQWAGSLSSEDLESISSALRLLQRVMGYKEEHDEISDVKNSNQYLKG